MAHIYNSVKARVTISSLRVLFTPTGIIGEVVAKIVDPARIMFCLATVMSGCIKLDVKKAFQRLDRTYKHTN